MAHAVGGGAGGAQDVGLRRRRGVRALSGLGEVLGDGGLGVGGLGVGRCDVFLARGPGEFTGAGEGAGPGLAQGLQDDDGARERKQAHAEVAPHAELVEQAEVARGRPALEGRGHVVEVVHVGGASGGGALVLRSGARGTHWRASLLPG